MSLTGWVITYKKWIENLCLCYQRKWWKSASRYNRHKRNDESQVIRWIFLKMSQKTEDRFKCKIRNFVTDNTANMMPNDFAVYNTDDNKPYGCSAPIFWTYWRKIYHQSNHHIPKARYVCAGGSELVIHLKVRWNAMFDS